MTRLDFLVVLAALVWVAVRSTPDRLWHLAAHIYGPWHPYPTWSYANELSGRRTEQAINSYWRKCRVCGWVDSRTVYFDWVQELDARGQPKRLSDAQGRDPWSDDYGKP